MAKIVIENLNNKEVTSIDNSKTVLDIIHENGIDWMHACGKNGRCTTCKIILVEGKEQLSAVNDAEQKFLDIGRLKDGERLACQTYIKGNIVIKVAQANKFPHMEYSD